ncbi:PAS domain S-box protein [Halovalidus salilacus]|uniref:PAS domain S-box protein n=1 Tax=Halovalidus salilacus TaxID=3075124 RepID=UPI003608B1E4
MLTDDPDVLSAVRGSRRGDGDSPNAESDAGGPPDRSPDARRPAERSSAGSGVPVVYVFDDEAEDGGEADLTRALERGAATVVPRSAVSEPTPAYLAHRIDGILEREESERASERRETWYRSLLRHATDTLLVLDEDHRLVYASPAVERIAGYDPDGLRDVPASEVVHPDDVDEYLEAVEAAHEGGPGATATCEYRCRYADGAERIHEAVVTNRLEEPIDGIVVAARDVTDYRVVERELRETFDRVTDAFLALDADMRFTYVNDRAESILRADRSELLGRRFLDVYPELSGSSFDEATVEAVREQEVRTIEDYYGPSDAWIEARIYPSETGVSVYFRDVTERVERERELAERTERLETLVEHVPLVLFTLDDEGTIVLSEGPAIESSTIDPADVTGESFFDVLEDYPLVRAEAKRALEGESVHTRRRVGDRTFEAWLNPVTGDGGDGGEPDADGTGDGSDVDGDVERVIGVAIDVTERVQYEETLNALHEATRHLLTVDSKREAAEYIVDVASSVLDLESIVYRFDEHRNELVPAAYDRSLDPAISPPPSHGPNSSITWRTFVSGTPVAHDDVREDPDVYTAEPISRSGLFVPLGEHGVFVAASPEIGAFDEQTFELAQLLAATAETALDRIGHTRRLHERERDLERQNERLERLNRAGAIREGIEELLLLSDTREEIEAGVCERIADLEECSFAWIGEPDPGGTHVEPRATAGLGRGYLEAVTITTVDDSAAEPSGRATRTRRPTYVGNVAGELRDGSWRLEALSRNFQSAFSVPLVYDDFVYGVLTVYGERPDAFDETVRSTLAELGETIAYTIDAVRRRRSLLGGTVTELDLELEEESAFERLASRFDARVTLEGAIPQDDGSTIAFVALETSLSEADAESLACDGVADASIIAEGEEESLVQLLLTERFLGAAIHDNGGVLRDLSVDEGVTRATVAIPEVVAARELLSGINRSGVKASMVARREESTGDTDVYGRAGRNPLFEALTDRQHEVVRTAYHAGFFEWPRRTTGEAIADSLDISPPAFHKHVRSAERKLFESLFGRGVTTGYS